MRNFNQFFTMSLFTGIVRALLLFILAWIIAAVAKKIVVKLLHSGKVDSLLSKGRQSDTPEDGKKRVESIGKFVYFLVFILFMPSILDALNMNAVSGPISNMMQNLLAFIPNIIGAGVILFVGYFFAKMLRDIVYSLLLTVNIDKWYNKVSPEIQKPSDKVMVEKTKENVPTLAKILSNIIFGVILIPVITMALETLNINTLTQPIVLVLNKVLNMIPNIFVAIILIVLGYFIGKFIGQLLAALLTRMGIQRVYSWMDESKTSHIPRFDLGNGIGNVVQGLIILFVTVEALRVLQLDVLNTIGNAIIAYIPLLLSGLIIIGLGVFGGYFIENMIKKYMNSPFTAAIAKYIIIIFAVFMTLAQIQFASTIVNIAFLLILGGLSVAFALAFGIGGRDFAKKQLEKFDKKLEEDSRRTNISEEILKKEDNVIPKDVLDSSDDFL